MPLRMIEDAMLFPGASTQGREEATVYLSADSGATLARPTTAAGDLIAVAGRRPVDPEAGAVLAFYGNAMCLAGAVADLDWYAGPGRARGAAVAEYVGYGLSTGVPSERGCAETADAAYDLLTRDWGVSPNRLIIAGWSLGAAVAIDLASRREAAGLAAFSAFTSVPELVGEVIPRAFQAAAPWLARRARNRFDNLKKIGRAACPIFLAHGRRDALIPFRMAAALREAASTPVTFLPVASAGHNDLFDRGGERLRLAFDHFARAAIAGRGRIDEPNPFQSARA